MVLGQLATEAKSNEIKTVPKLLDLLDLEGAVVTADRPELPEDHRPQDRGGQGGLLASGQGQSTGVAMRSWNSCSTRACVTIAKASPTPMPKRPTGGTVVSRRVGFGAPGLWTGLPIVENGRGWPASFVSNANANATPKRRWNDRYYISSLDGHDAETLLGHVRGHWSIENQLHWSLDVSFREDDRRIRQGHAAENFSRLSRIALNLLKTDMSIKLGIKAKRKTAGWDHDYLLKLITQET